MQNIHTIAADIKHKNSIYEPTVTSNDDIVFIVKVTDDGSQVPLDLVKTAVLANTRGDRQTVLTPGTVQTDGDIRFELGTSETAIPGQVKAVVQLYNASSERISTIDFSYKVLRDPTGEGYIPSEIERTLIEVVLEDGPGIMAAAQQATEQAVAVTGATEAERVATQEERLLTRGIRENMELVRQATITVKNDTEAVQLATEEVRKNTEAERLATEAVKKSTDVVRADTEKARDTASLAASQTQQVKTETAAVRDATQKVQDATVLVKNETQKVQEATEAVRLATAKVRDETNQAKTATVNATAAATQATEDSLAVTQNARQELATFGTDAANALQAFDQQSASDLQEFDTTSRNALETFDSQAVSIVYEAQQATVKANEAAAGTQGAIDYATKQGNFALQVAEANRTKWLPPVATFAELATKYPKPNEGDTVRVTAEARIYKFSGGAWIVTDEYNPTAIDEVASKVNETARQTQLLQNGVNVLNADVATPVDFEIHGRTLTSLANSNLEQLKYYVLADKKTKIIVDNATIAGIGKFQKKSTTLTTADFVGKVPGSTVANPHISHIGSASTLRTPSSFAYEDYSNIQSLNGISNNYANITSGNMAQRLFSFNIIEQVERQLGLIPKATVAEKVQWIKDNVNMLKHAWHGFGSGPAGNKASFAEWRDDTKTWVNALSHTNGTVTRILNSIGSSSVARVIDANGFAHYLAYAEPSDGVTASTINTDFINLEIELKATAQLNTRGKIIRVENFEGKVAGSNVENPHTIKRNHYNTNGAFKILMTPTSANYEATNAEYNTSMKLDNSLLSGYATTVSGEQSQQLFSFNLIEAIERNVGKIPASDTAGKVAWLKNNISSNVGIWRGFGSGPSGSRAKVGMWYVTGNIWLTTDGGWFAGNTNNTSWYANQIKTTPGVGTSVQNTIDASGFIHFLAYAEPSDGVTASTINTDYIELEIELKPDANFANPKVPLYEVTKEEFDKISITWSDEETLKRFPIVEGTQHLLNPYVMAEGENLLPPPIEIEKYNSVGSTAFDNEYKDGKLAVYSNAGSYHGKGISLDVVPNQPYTLSFKGEANAENVQPSVRVGYSATSTELYITYSASGYISKTFTPLQSKIFIQFNGNSSAKMTSPVLFSDLTLNLGTTAKPFTPRNPSYLYAETKLGAIGNAKDVLFRQDGQWKRRKVVEKDVLLDGSVPWERGFDYVGQGFKSVYTTRADLKGLPNTSVSYNNQGEALSNKYGNGFKEMSGFDGVIYATTSLVISAANADSGFADAYTPTNANWKQYFNGWKYTDGVTWQSVTGNGQTATAQQALDTKPTDYTPYKLSYVLANPIIENVNVDGDIVADGLTQMEIGAGFSFADVNGKRTYTRTPVSQRPKLTTNPVDLKAIFAKNIRSAVDDLATKASDNTTRLSIHERSILEIYIKVKALGV